MLVLVFPMTNNYKFRQPHVVGIIDVRVQHTFLPSNVLGSLYVAFMAYRKSLIISLCGYGCCKVRQFYAKGQALCVKNV